MSKKYKEILFCIVAFIGFAILSSGLKSFINIILIFILILVFVFLMIKEMKNIYCYYFVYKNGLIIDKFKIDTQDDLPKPDLHTLKIEYADKSIVEIDVEKDITPSIGDRIKVIDSSTIFTKYDLAKSFVTIMFGIWINTFFISEFFTAILP